MRSALRTRAARPAISDDNALRSHQYETHGLGSRHFKTGGIFALKYETSSLVHETGWVPDPAMGRSHASVRRGRPRDEDARRAILDAAYQLVRERGFAAVTTAQIAARAGTGKQTLYRWWSSKSALVLDALADWIAQHEDAARRTLSAFLVQLCRGATDAAPILRSLFAEAQRDAALRAALERRLVGPLRAALRACLMEFRPAEREMLVGAIYGAVLYQLMLHQPLDAVFVRSVTRMVSRLA